MLLVPPTEWIFVWIQLNYTSEHKKLCTQLICILIFIVVLMVVFNESRKSSVGVMVLEKLLLSYKILGHPCEDACPSGTGHCTRPSAHKHLSSPMTAPLMTVQSNKFFT